jgi:hypothetical protein
MSNKIAREAFEIQDAIKRRQIAFLSGRPNGKTHVYHRAQEQVAVKSGSIYRLKPRDPHPEDNQIEFVTDIAFPQSSRIIATTIMRQVIGLYGLRVPQGTHMVIRRFRSLLEEFYHQDKILCIAFDNAELIPERGYSILKYMNEFRYKGLDIGTAVLLSGEYARMRMPYEFLKRTTEIPVGKLDAMEDVIALIETHFPGMRSMFTEQDLNVIQAYPTTIEQRDAAQRALQRARRLRKDRLTIELPQLAKVA